VEGMNNAILIGNLGADPELKFTQSGQAVLNMRLATTESYLDKDKVRRERTDWHSVVVWGKRGEALAKILTKGSGVCIEGSIRTSSYDGPDGTKRYRTDIVAKSVRLIGRREPSGGDKGDEGRVDERGRGTKGGSDRGPKGGNKQAAQTSAPAQSGAIASDVELDGKWGDPIVRYDPRNWKGRSYVGAHYSQTEPAYLDMVAENLEWKSKNPKPGKEQYVDKDRKDATLARGWAQRLRKSGMGGDGPGVSVPESAADYDEYGGDYNDDDIPF